jgi:hypothetical protein
MKLLVACPRMLLLVNAQTSEVHLVEDDRPEYYGISWPANGQAMYLGHSGLENARLSSLRSYMDSECGWVSCGEVNGPSSLSLAHQILCTGDRIVATNTGRNCLTVFRTDDWFYRHYWIDQHRWDRMGTDEACGSHFNSLFLQNDTLYVVAHNHNRGSAIVRLAWPEMELLGIDETPTLMAHNLWVTDEGQMIVCDSMRGTLVDVVTGDVLWQCDMPQVVTRGLACDGNHVFIGHSAIGPRAERVDRDGRVWIVERASWTTVDSLRLPGSGNVHEVRLIDAPDHCHHGHPFRGRIATRGRIAEVVIAGKTPAAQWQQAVAEAPGKGTWHQHVAFARLDNQGAKAADFSLATLSPLLARDVKVRATVDVRDDTARHAGLVARYRGPGDSNVVVALLAKSELGYSVQLWHHHDGRWSLRRSTKTLYGLGELELQVIGDGARVTMAGEALIHATIPGPPWAGRVGMRSAGGTLSDFQAESLEVSVGHARRKSA